MQDLTRETVNQDECDGERGISFKGMEEVRVLNYFSLFIKADFCR